MRVSACRGEMSRRNENWLLVEWSGGVREAVHIKSLIKPLAKDLKVGCVVTLRWRGEPQTATLIARARDRDQLSTSPDKEVAGPSPKPDEEPRDYSPSGSSWAPSGEEDSDSDHENHKKIKLDHSKRHFINRRSSKKVMTPSHRAPAVIPKIMQDALKFQDSKNETRKRAHNGDSRNGSINKSLPDSTKRNNTSEVSGQTVTIDARELAAISNSFRILFRMIEELKRPYIQTPDPPQLPVYETTIENSKQSRTYHDTSIPITNETVIEAEEEFEENDEYENEEFNRSDDNVLITNKYDNQYNAAVIKPVNNNQYTAQVNPGVRSETSTQNQIEVKDTGNSEWVPIGSGKTLIHMDQWRKVNWKSYTVATRTLLLAVFPRRILATHCLTGKKSPAFQNKPAKMCLDPKITSDVIMEIMDRFGVKENLVRGIITTKCADECKMWRQRANKKKGISRSSSKLINHENKPPNKENFEQTNQVAQ